MSYVDKLRSDLEKQVSTLPEREQELFRAGVEFGYGRVFHFFSDVPKATELPDAVDALWAMIRMECDL